MHMNQHKQLYASIFGIGLLVTVRLLLLFQFLPEIGTVYFYGNM